MRREGGKFTNLVKTNYKKSFTFSFRLSFVNNFKEAYFERKGWSIKFLEIRWALKGRNIL